MKQTCTKCLRESPEQLQNNIVTALCCQLCDNLVTSLYESYQDNLVISKVFPSSLLEVVIVNMLF